MSVSAPSPFSHASFSGCHLSSHFSGDGLLETNNGEDYVGDESSKYYRTKYWDRKDVHRCHPTVLASGKMKVMEKPNQLDSVVKISFL